MDIGKITYYARRVHRLSLWFVVGFGLTQLITGLTMKYPEWFPFMDQNGSRLLHFQTAGYFALAFGIQMLTGVIMYISPWLLKKLMRPPAPPVKLPN